MTKLRMSWDDFLQTLYYDPEETSEEEWQDYVEQLLWLHTHPMDINRATAEEMAALPLLTPAQIESIQQYVHLDGPMKSVGELALVPGLDQETCRILPLFFYVGETTLQPSHAKGLKEWFGRMQNTVDTRLDVPLYYRRGYVNGNYYGTPLYHRLRYTLKSDHVQLGAHMEKDPGEGFADSYGGYVAISDRGILRRAIIGDYRAGWGEGLVMGSGVYCSKGNLTTSPSQGIRPMTGTSESGFLRGVAVTLSSPGGAARAQPRSLAVEGSLLFSYRTIDATLNSRGEVQTILESGYHRTATERANKNNTETLLLGAHVQMDKSGYTLGATAYWQHFNRLLSPGSQLYRRWYPRGQDFGAVGVHAAYAAYRWNVATELAYSTQYGGWASLGRVAWVASRNLKLLLLGRYYGYKYYSFQSSAVGENSRVQNESGLLLRVDCRPIDRLAIIAWYDLFADTWPRYGMTTSSRGQELLLEACWEMAPKQTLTLRYQMKRKAYNDSIQPHHKLRAQWTYKPSDRWKWQTTAYLHLSSPSPSGFGVSQLLNANILPKSNLRVGLMTGFFYAPDYSTRVYIYEPSLWGNSSYPSAYYGEGVRTAVSARYTFPRGHWMAEVKYSFTQMLDRNTISSDNQEILSSARHDISMQLRLTY